MQKQHRHGISLLRKQGDEVDIERVSRTIILDWHGEIGIAVDPILRFAPIVLRLPVLLRLSQPVAGDSEGREVAARRDRAPAWLRRRLVQVGPDRRLRPALASTGKEARLRLAGSVL